MDQTSWPIKDDHDRDGPSVLLARHSGTFSPDLELATFVS